MSRAINRGTGMERDFFIEVNSQQRNHHGERICGDVFLSVNVREENRIITVLSDGSIIRHCWQGKHRNGALGCFMYMLLCGCSKDEAGRTYKECNCRLRGHDVRLVVKPHSK